MILTEKIRTARDRKIRYRYHAHAPERVFGRRRASDARGPRSVGTQASYKKNRRQAMRGPTARRRDRPFQDAARLGITPLPCACGAGRTKGSGSPKTERAEPERSISFSAQPSGHPAAAGGFPRGRILKSLRNVPVPSESEKPSTAASKPALASKDGTGFASAMAMDPMLYAGLQADEAGSAFLERRMDSRCLPASIDVTPRRRRTRWGRRPS